MGKKPKYLILFILTTLIIGLDQITKLMVIQQFRLGESISIIAGYFNFTYVRNTGAAFGLLARSDPSFRIPFFVIVPIIALVAIGFIFKKIADNDFKLSSALSMVIGGAVGNLIDRVQFGYVIDFLDFHWLYKYHFPAFNVADSAICVGVGILMLDLVFQNQDKEKEIKTNAPATN